MPQIYDMGPTALLPLRRKACWVFFRPKNPTNSAVFEPANLGTEGQRATPTPPKPLKNLIIFFRLFLFSQYVLITSLFLSSTCSSMQNATCLFQVHTSQCTHCTYILKSSRNAWHEVLVHFRQMREQHGRPRRNDTPIVQIDRYICS